MDFLTSTFAGELTGLTQQPHSTKHGNSFPCNYNNLDLDKTSFKGLNINIPSISLNGRGSSHQGSIIPRPHVGDDSQELPKPGLG